MCRCQSQIYPIFLYICKNINEGNKTFDKIIECGVGQKQHSTFRTYDKPQKLYERIGVFKDRDIIKAPRVRIKV